MPDRVGGAAILALHCLRDLRPGTPAIDLEFLQGVVRDDFDAQERDGLAALALACGANETLKPFFGASHVRMMDGATATAAQLEDWRVVSSGHFAPSVAWVDALRKARMHAWPAIAWRSFWLTESDIRRVEPNVGSGWSGLMWGRIRRLARGVKTLPRAFRIVILRRDG